MKIAITIFLVTFLGCRTNAKVAHDQNDKLAPFAPVYATGPQALVYKTRGDYANLVPVILSDDKKEIVSYPHPGDLKTVNGYPLPDHLLDGYLLDNRGIGKNVAFLKLTYAEYASLEQMPTLQELYDLIIDKNPLTELCDCGSKQAFSDTTGQLNKLISDKKLRTVCKAIK